MNAARVAALLRELADELDVPAEDGEREREGRPARARKPRRVVRLFPAPSGPVSETDRARAAKMLARRGIRA